MRKGGQPDGDNKLFRIGEIARMANVSQRTIDYYTKLGLISPEKRSNSNYRYYSYETLNRLKRIESMKREKFTLEEIKSSLDLINKVSNDEQVNDRLAALQLQMQQLEKEVKELSPLIDQLKPNQAKNLYKLLTPQSAAVIEALLLLLGKGPLL
ncbi:MerR family transcriptional regulator [Paenibacillus sp. 32O-W]|uniref:MerR family transcriptional regulator n=1 Tax=Paenibacillus sp. 32O-W TaxID=1695218 RepID=UPI0021B65ABF|nr:MerR family transcriptional regulator [Paenibacillus sp. 32O-W]